MVRKVDVGVDVGSFRDGTATHDEDPGPVSSGWEMFGKEGAKGSQSKDSLAESIDAGDTDSHDDNTTRSDALHVPVQVSPVCPIECKQKHLHTVRKHLCLYFGNFYTIHTYACQGGFV